MTRRTRTHAAMLAWIAAWLIAAYALAPGAPTTHAAAPAAAPSGRIGTPLSTHKPPKEPRLTMPPTDTAGG